jgi:putative transposase
MRKSKYSEEQIAFALRQVEAGTPVVTLVRKMGITEQTFYRWRNKFGSMGVSEIRQLKEYADENRNLKQLVADLALDKKMLQEALRKKP